MISVVIPSRTAENLTHCIAAVRKHEPESQILVVDDGVDWFKFKGQTIGCNLYCVDGQRPFVYAVNSNIGIRESLNGLSGTTCEGVVLLNDDALLETPGGFTLLAESAREHPEFGIIGSTCNNVGNRNQFPRGVGLREEPRMVCFVAVFIPRTTIETVGLLDERYVGYGMDDDDYCFEVRKAGLKIGIHDGCFVDHKTLVSSYRGDPRTPANFLPNLELFKQKWGHDNWGKPA